MSLGDHLREFRNRIFLIAGGVLVGSVVGWFLAEWVLGALVDIIQQLSAERQVSLNYGTVTSAFDIHLQLAITIGIVITSPWWLWQVWAYIGPALKRTEKRYALGFLGAALPLFVAGCAIGWLVLPNLFVVLTGFGQQETTAFIEARTYVDFVLRLLLAIGIGFVSPVVLVLLNFIGVLSGRAIFKAWRWAVLAIMLFTAVVTPSADVLSMFLLALPILGLYVIAGGIALWHDRRSARRLAAEIGGLPEVAT